jgi:GT2 family glycosyltransferase
MDKIEFTKETDNIKSPKKNEKKMVSVIIVNYNGIKFIEDCVKSVLSSGYPNELLEIIVVDNCSTDGSPELIEKLPVKLIRAKENKGWGAGNNLGAKDAKGDILLFLNPDTEVKSDFIQPLVHALSIDNNLGAVSPKIVYFNDQNKINSLGLFLSYFSISGAIGKGENIDKYNKEMEVFAPSGACFAIKKEFFQQTGGFDEDLFMYCDDLDFGWALRNLGYSIKFIPNSSVYHKEYGSTLPRPKYYYFNLRNTLWTVSKHASTTQLPRFLFFAFILGLGEFFIFRIKGKKEHANAILQALRDAIGNSNLSRMRKKIKNRKRTKSKTLSLFESIYTIKRLFNTHFTN